MNTVAVNFRRRRMIESADIRSYPVEIGCFSAEDCAGRPFQRRFFRARSRDCQEVVRVKRQSRTVCGERGSTLTEYSVLISTFCLALLVVVDSGLYQSQDTLYRELAACFEDSAACREWAQGEAQQGNPPGVEHQPGHRRQDPDERFETGNADGLSTDGGTEEGLEFDPVAAAGPADAPRQGPLGDSATGSQPQVGVNPGNNGRVYF